MQRPESLSCALGEIQKEICALRIDTVSISADPCGTVSIDEIVLAPRNGGRYRLVLAVGPEEGGALHLYEAGDGNVNDLSIPPATVASFCDEVSA